MTHATAADVELLEVAYRGGEHYEIGVRGHRIAVDQPVAAGGADRAPTPTELFVASLAACVAYYAGRYLTRHGFDRDGMQVRAGFGMAADRPARVAWIRIVVHPPAGFPAERVPALTAVASHCTVHNSLSDPPRVDVRVG
jgi:putative redox protein